MEDKHSRISFYNQISKNKWSSFFFILVIFIVLIVLITVIGFAFGGIDIFVILILAIIISLIYIFSTYYNSHKIAVASVGAKPADKNTHRQFYHSVEGLTLASGMPMPKLYVMDDPNINAFATGRDPEHAVICVTTGTLEKLNKQELEGVLAHELSHIANYDIRFMAVATIMVGVIAIISQIFLRSLFFRGRGDSKGNPIFLIIAIILAILAPLIVTLVQLAISRKREYVADATAVKFMRTPTGLIGALKKINNSNHIEKKGSVSKALSPLFISDPFKKNIDGFFSTHPPLEKRIATLERM
ncbi:M48 family metallopeptidase [Candidatus Pacearchaeota archaeon]|nr:M48 family metallopeptidase [Candidatus Pacearchaeota archaeon]